MPYGEEYEPTPTPKPSYPNKRYPPE